VVGGVVVVGVDEEQAAADMAQARRMERSAVVWRTLRPFVKRSDTESGPAGPPARSRAPV